MEPHEKDKEALVSGIEADAKGEAEKLLDDARKRADEKREYTAKKVESILAEAHENAKEQAETARQKILSDADLEIKRRFLRLRNTLIQQIQQRVENRLNSIIDEPGYRNVLINWITEAAVGLGADSAKVNASEKELALIDEELLNEVTQKVRNQTGKEIKLTISDERPLKSQGMVLTTADGRVAFNNQVKARLSRKQREIIIMIYEKLFAEQNQT